MRPLPPDRRIRRWHTYLVVWGVHRVLGLGAGLLLLLLSVTGSLLVIHHDLERWLGGPYRLEHDMAPAGPPPGWHRLVADVAPQAPAGYRAYRLLPAAAADEPLKLMFVDPRTGTRWSALLDPRQGEVLWQGPDQALFTPWLLQLHMTLRIGPWGYAVTGLAGAALLLLGLTGLYLHRYDIASIWRRPPWRWGRGWRAFLHDTHTWIGAASLYFSVVLGATGLAFAILILPGQLRPRPEPLPAFPLADLTPLEPVAAAARAVVPGHELVRISFPTDRDGPLRLLLLDRDAPVWAKFSTVDADARTGQIQRVRHGREANTAAKWRAVVAPLHFGFYGATWVKIAYAIGGLAPGLLAITGTAIWWRRTRRQGIRPSRRAVFNR